jgi:aspartate kinase
MLIVQKFGGTSVGSIDRIRNVARRIVDARRSGNDVIVVVSAMAGETDRLINLAYQMCDNPEPRELDVLISTGEQVSTALVAMAIIDLGFRAISLQNHQVKLITDSSFTKARIRKIDADRILKIIDDGVIPVIAGFQGIDEHGNITTLGRGGSDTTAVAIASALISRRGDVLCEIYTDVEGIYTADPSLVPDARKLDEISYEEMLELASSGARVLQARSVGLGMKYKVPIHVRSSFSTGKGTIIKEETKDMEKVVVRGIAYDKNEAKITVISVPDRPGIAARIFEPLAGENIIVDMIIQSSSVDGFTDVSFTVPRDDYKKAMELLKPVARRIGSKGIIGDEKIAKVSVVGVGMRTHSGVASRMFSALARAGINIQMISTSEIKISCVVGEDEVEKAVRVLHNEFKPGEEEQVEIREEIIQNKK